MIGGIDRLSQQIAELAGTRASMMYEVWGRAIESPIERLLLVGINALVEQEAAVCFWKVVLSDGRQPLTERQAEEAAQDGSLLVAYQVKLVDWRADFVLSAPSCSNRKIIVECDGHDFHERTKEQAAKDRSRDRAATAAGHRILRFTGSELYRNPMGCVEELMKQAVWLVEG